MIMNMMIWKYMSTRRMASQFAALPQKEKKLAEAKVICYFLQKEINIF